MRTNRIRTPVALVVVALAIGMAALLLRAPNDGAGPVLKTESFDRDPGWDHANNRPADRKEEPVPIRQDFGYSRSTHAGGKAGEVGGFIQAAAEPAYYGKEIAPATLDQPLAASGTLSVADGGTHLLLGFFNAGTTNEWRTPNTIALRIDRPRRTSRLPRVLHRQVAGGGDGPQSFPTAEDPKTGRKSLVGFPSGGKAHRWSLAYDPEGNNGAGRIPATIDDATAVCHLDPAHRADGASFNRFGLLNVMKSADGGTEVYLDDVTVNGHADSFDADPKWDGTDNRKYYRTSNVRPASTSATARPDSPAARPRARSAASSSAATAATPRMAYYADRVGPLTLDKPIHASPANSSCSAASPTARPPSASSTANARCVRTPPRPTARRRASSASTSRAPAAKGSASTRSAARRPAAAPPARPTSRPRLPRRQAPQLDVRLRPRGRERPRPDHRSALDGQAAPPRPAGSRQGQRHHV